jgi:hypothetical protein
MSNAKVWSNSCSATARAQADIVSNDEGIQIDGSVNHAENAELPKLKTLQRDLKCTGTT